MGGDWSWGVWSGGAGYLVLGGCLDPGGLVPGVMPSGDPPETAIAADGTHSTGMYSCSSVFSDKK